MSLRCKLLSHHETPPFKRPGYKGPQRGAIIPFQCNSWIFHGGKLVLTLQVCFLWPGPEREQFLFYIKKKTLLVKVIKKKQSIPPKIRHLKSRVLMIRSVSKRNPRFDFKKFEETLRKTKPHSAVTLSKA